MGRVIERTVEWGNGVKKTQKSTYNKRGQLATETLASGKQLSYKYTEYGEIQSLYLDGKKLITGLNSNTDTARQLTYQLGNGEQVTKNFVHGQLTRMAVDGRDTRAGSAGDGLPKIERRWSYNKAGNIDKSWSNDQENSFTYDLQDRLIGSMTQSGRSKYKYDNNDNQVSALINDSTREFQYLHLNNQLSEVAPELSAPFSLAYDIAGNVIQTGEFSYSYNARGRLATVHHKDELVGEYRYNTWGQRSRKTSTLPGNAKRQTEATTQTTYFLYTDNKLSAEFDETGKQVVDYLYYGNQPLAKVTNDGVFYIHVNAQGAPEWMTDEQQEIVWHGDYQPYGAVLLDEERESLNLRLPGQYYDRESGLHYNLNRYYSSSLGRYITPDPSGFSGGVNRYAYANANPSRFVDPLGLEACVFSTPNASAGNGGGASPGAKEDEPGINGFDYDWKAELALDVIGLFEPTPFADIANGSALLADGRKVEGVLTYLGIIPVVGDIVGKGLKYVYKGGRAIVNLVPLGRLGDLTAAAAKAGWNGLKWTAGKGLEALRWTANKGRDGLRWAGRKMGEAGSWIGDKIGGIFGRSTDEVADVPVPEELPNDTGFIGTSNGDVGDIRDLGPRKTTGLERELRVAEIVDGKSASISRISKNGKVIVEDTPIIRNGEVVGGIDVFGKEGELIQVGGPGKNADDAVFEKTKRSLNALKDEASKRGTTAQVYYERGSSARFDDLIKESQRILGAENVFILPN